MFLLKSCNVYDPEVIQSKKHKVQQKVKDLMDLLNSPSIQLVNTFYSKIHHSLILCLNNGFICWIFLHQYHHRLQDVYIDKYVPSHVVVDHMMDYVFCEGEAAFMSFQNRVVALLFSNHHRQGTSVSKPSSPSVTHATASSIHHLKDMKWYKLKHQKDLTIIELPFTTRKGMRTVVTNHEMDRTLPLVCVWWQNQRVMNQLNTWSPSSTSQQEESNIVVYSYDETRVDLVSFTSLASHIHQVRFSKCRRNQLLILSSDSDHDLKVYIFEVICQPVDSLEGDFGPSSDADMDKVLIPISVTSIPLVTPLVDLDLTGSQDRLGILCKDRNVLWFNLFDHSVLHLRTSLDGVSLRCHFLNGWFLVADKFGHLLMYDAALNVIPSNYEDVSFYANLEFVDQVHRVTLLSDRLLCLYYSSEDTRQKLTLIQLPSNTGLPQLVKLYVKHDYVSEAISLLLTIDWNIDPFTAYTSLNAILNHLMKMPLNSTREVQMEQTLGSFFRSMKHMDVTIDREYRIGMTFLAKRFFFHLVRFNSVHKAFRLAVELKSNQLLHMIYKLAIERGDTKMTQDCIEQVARLKEKQEKRRNQRAIMQEKEPGHKNGHHHHDKHNHDYHHKSQNNPLYQNPIEQESPSSPQPPYVNAFPSKGKLPLPNGSGDSHSEGKHRPPPPLPQVDSLSVHSMDPGHNDLADVAPSRKRPIPAPRMKSTSSNMECTQPSTLSPSTSTSTSSCNIPFMHPKKGHQSLSSPSQPSPSSSISNSMQSNPPHLPPKRLPFMHHNRGGNSSMIHEATPKMMLNVTPWSERGIPPPLPPKTFTKRSQSEQLNNNNVYQMEPGLTTVPPPIPVTSPNNKVVMSAVKRSTKSMTSPSSSSPQPSIETEKMSNPLMATQSPGPSICGSNSAIKPGPVVESSSGSESSSHRVISPVGHKLNHTIEVEKSDGFRDKKLESTSSTSSSSSTTTLTTSSTPMNKPRIECVHFGIV